MKMDSLGSQLKRWCFVVSFFALSSCCRSDNGPGEIVTRALECFSRQYAYRNCQDAYRLGAQGALNVPYQAADAYCGGPCLEETRLVLSCIDGIVDSFRFYNGASTRDVRYALRRGCGHNGRRGDFDVLDHSGWDGNYYGDYYGDYDSSIKFPVPMATVVAGICVAVAPFLL